MTTTPPYLEIEKDENLDSEKSAFEAKIFASKHLSIQNYFKIVNSESRLPREMSLNNEKAFAQLGMANLFFFQPSVFSSADSQLNSCEANENYADKLVITPALV